MRTPHGEDGQALLETLLTLPAVLLACFGLLSLAMLLATRITLDHVATELALCPNSHNTEAQCRRNFVQTIESALPSTKVVRLNTTYTPTAAHVRVEIRTLDHFLFTKQLDQPRPVQLNPDRP